MNKLVLSIFESPLSMTPLLHYAPTPREMSFSTNEHGFAAAEFRLPIDLVQSFYFYAQSNLAHVVLAWNAIIVWEGRLEDVAIENDGLRLTAFGYWRALFDVPYTALWSTTRYGAWRAMTIDDRANTRSEKYESDNNNRLWLAPRKNETMTTTTFGRMGFVAPDRGARYLSTVSFNYDVFLDSGWTAALISLSGGLGGTATTEWSLTGNGSSQTGSANVTLSNATADALLIQIAPASGTYTNETGARYVKLTNVRIKTTPSAAVYADEIVAALLEFIHVLNPNQLQAASAFIESPLQDLRDEIYEDMPPGEIVLNLIRRGDYATPPRQWEVGVWENRLLHFRPRGSAGRTWYVEARAIEIERTLEALHNSGYVIYQSANDEARRTVIATDATSVTRYGLTRRKAQSLSTTSATLAELLRDTALMDGATPRPRSAIVFDVLYDAAGSRWPLWMCRSGDTLVLRNLPPTLDDEIDRIRSFIVSETIYDAVANRLQVTPETPLPRIEVLLSTEAAPAA